MAHWADGQYFEYFGPVVVGADVGTIVGSGDGAVELSVAFNIKSVSSKLVMGSAVGDEVARVGLGLDAFVAAVGFEEGLDVGSAVGSMVTFVGDIVGTAVVEFVVFVAVVGTGVVISKSNESVRSRAKKGAMLKVAKHAVSCTTG